MLMRAGISEGDTLMVHSSMKSNSGFKGTINDFIESFISVIGHTGNLTMMSMSYQGISSKEFLAQGKPFDVRKSISMVGLPTEIFRRRNDVLRGLHPTHSVAAWGQKSEWLVQEQENDINPFGNKSPFHKLLELDGKIILFDVPFNTMTFEHYLENRFKEYVPVSLFEDTLKNGIVIDRSGATKEISTLVLNEKLNKMRDSRFLEQELKKRAAIKYLKIGRSEVAILSARDAVEVSKIMFESGKGFYAEI